MKKDLELRRLFRSFSYSMYSKLDSRWFVFGDKQKLGCRFKKYTLELVSRGFCSNLLKIKFD